MISLDNTKEVSYVIETRDINGNREISCFESREDFYTYAVEVYTVELPKSNLPPEILLVASYIPGFGTNEHVVMYSALSGEPLFWDELIAYLG